MTDSAMSAPTTEAPGAEQQARIDELCVNTIRTLSMDAVQQANSGHPGTPMALAPVGYVLYTRIMRHNPANAAWLDRDRFVLSCGEYGAAPGIEATTGPLGQGIGNSVGLALAERMLAARFNSGEHAPIDHHVFTIVSDGDVEEGVSSEACSLAGHLGLGRLVAFYDDNHISIEGDTALAFSEDVGTRFAGYDWHVQNLGEDLSLDRIEEATRIAMAVEDRPSLIICRTHIAIGSPNKVDSASAHGSPLGEEEVRLTKEAYGWPVEPPFLVPPEVLAHFRATLERGDELEREWEERLKSYRAELPEQAAALAALAGPRKPHLASRAPLVRFDAGESMATRKASQKVIQAAAESVPLLVGGSADLAPSTLTLIDGAGGVERGSYGGRNLHFGVREHGMGTVVNGLVLGGMPAYGSTFFVFCDYMKAAIRLAAISELPSIFVFTHDSIGVGEDGPTHQPVEQLATLRAMPNIDVVRPADANETALAWSWALCQTDRPTALVLTRQSLPVIDPDAVPQDAIERGAYVLRDCDGEPQAILIATGSEVAPCLEAAGQLDEAGIAARVVSMPCMESFAAQSADYRESVLPSACRVRVAVEAASPFGWERWVGEDGAMIGMTTFGASAPEGDTFEHFGFTAGAITARVIELRG